MADQHNDNIPALADQIVNDVPDIKENLEYHKDVFQNFCTTWSNTVATGIYPQKFADTTGTPVILQCKIINMGDWNMDTTANISVAHGLTQANIRHVSAIIRSDDDADYIPIPYHNTVTGAVEVFLGSVASENLNIYRVAGTTFDGTAYNATSFNRGWFAVWYVAS